MRLPPLSLLLTLCACQPTYIPYYVVVPHGYPPERTKQIIEQLKTASPSTDLPSVPPQSPPQQLAQPQPIEPLSIEELPPPTPEAVRSPQ